MYWRNNLCFGPAARYTVLKEFCMPNTIDVTGLPSHVIDEISALVAAKRKDLVSSNAPARKLSHEEWVNRYQAFLNKYRSTTLNLKFDDDRESIY
jgi:hypothetical protein